MVSKEKIIRLLKGTREDAIIACRLMVENYDPVEFIREFEDEKLAAKLYPKRVDPERPMFIWNLSIKDPFLFPNPTFYYHYSENLYILWCMNGCSICYKPYNPNSEIIEHE